MVCDECGRTFYASQMRERWDHAWVCKEDWEPRHPQLDVRGRRDRIRPPVVRPPIDCLGDLEMLDTLQMLDTLHMGARCIVANPITPDDL